MFRVITEVFTLSAKINEFNSICPRFDQAISNFQMNFDCITTMLPQALKPE